jgi:hypothetical protein
MNTPTAQIASTGLRKRTTIVLPLLTVVAAASSVLAALELRLKRFSEPFQ